MNNYYRITGYYKEDDLCFILDSFGKYEKLWQFSAHLIAEGIEVLAVGRFENIIDVNISPIEKADTENIFLRAYADGKPEYIEQVIDGITYKAIKVADKIYIPQK